MRRVNYRAAATAFVFTGLWFVLGLVLLFSGLPSALGIGWMMFVAWMLLFFGILGVSGLLLSLASWNAIFPARPSRDAQPPAETLRARAERLTSIRDRANRPTRAEDAAGDDSAAVEDLPWVTSPLPDRARRRRG